MWRAVVGLLWGPLLILIGMALAVDYRGIATRHIELAMRVVRPVPPARRPGWDDERLVRRRDFFVVLDRGFGVPVTLAGIVSSFTGAYLLTTL